MSRLLLKPALFTGVCTLMLSLASQAASFDCAKAKAADEIAICANRSLNDQDVTMALLYDLNKHFMAMGGRGSLMDGQADWLKQRRACGARLSCLSDAYTQRIGMLRGFIDERVMTKGPF
ncbi:lysozyme inhibitor LprI family protein [Pseudomonas cerasi]